VGTDDITLQLEVEGAGMLGGTFSSTIKNTEGHAVFTASGTVVGESIDV
jgi:hypothetical protein